jgi:TolA-binding protein
MGLLATRILAREPYDLLAMLTQWNRRRQFRAMTRSGARPWQVQAAGATPAGQITENEARIMELRQEITQAMATHDSEAALTGYRNLLELDANQVLHRQAQLDLANLAMHSGQYDLAAAAYEAFIRHYPTDEFTAEVRLILGLTYGRYLDEPDRARGHLTDAMNRLTSPPRRQLARDLLDELGPATK